MNLCDEWILYCEEAIINCDNYGGDIIFDLAISGENKEGKNTKSSEIIMKSSIRVCVHRKSSEWKESSESRKSQIVVYSRWNLEFEKLIKTVSQLYELLKT